MSLADDKRGVFTTIGSYTSLIEEPKMPFQTDLFDSINNKDDIVPFLLDVLKTVAGSDALKETIGGMFGSLIEEVEPKLKTELKKQFTQSNASEPLPASFISNGITVPVKTIDVGGKFKVAPDSQGGKLLYDTSIPNFDKRAHDAILNNGLPQGFSNLSLTYLEASDSFQIKPSGVSGINISEFFTSFIDDTQLINQKEITTTIMDNIYGTITNLVDKTEEQALTLLQVEALLQQVLDNNDSFVIAPDKYDELLTRSQELVNGVVSYDMGCGVMPASLGFGDLNELVSTISGATDPFYIGNQLDATIDESTSGSTETEELTTENRQTIKDGFFQKIIKIFTVQILYAVTAAPQIRTLLGMMSALQNEGVVLIDDATEDMKNFKTMINCMSAEVMALIAEFIFTLAASYLIKLLQPVIKRVIKEKINQYSDIIMSLTGALSKIKDVAGTVTDAIT